MSTSGSTALSRKAWRGCTRNDDMIAGVPRCRLTCGSNPHLKRGKMCHAQHACVWYHARAHRGLRGGAGFPHPWGDRLGMRDTGGPARPHLSTEEPKSTQWILPKILQLLAELTTSTSTITL